MTDSESPVAEDAATSEESTDALASLRESNRELAARLRAELLARDPGLPADLVTGETVDEIEASYAAARDLAARILGSASTRVPAGSPGRGVTGGLSARDRIRAGLANLPTAAP